MKRYFLIIFLFVCTLSCYAGIETECLVVNAPISKQIKKKDYSKITNLKIVGTIAEKDFELLSKLQNLESLNLSEADYSMNETILGYMNECVSLHYLHLKEMDFYPAPSLKNLTVDVLIGGNEENNVSFEMKRQMESIGNIQIDTLFIGKIATDQMMEESGVAPEENKTIYDLYFFGEIFSSVEEIAMNLFLPKVITYKNQYVINNIPYQSNRVDYPKSDVLMKRNSEENPPIVEKVLDLRGKVAIGEHYFENCTAEKIIFSSPVVLIKPYAFYNCEQLKEIVFEECEDGKILIEADAFNGCTNIEKITFGNEANIHTGAFSWAKINEIVFCKNANVEKDAIVRVNQVEFKEVPDGLDAEFTSSNPLIMIPSGTTNEFVKMGLKASNLVDASLSKSKSITLKQGGTILSELSLQDLKHITSLTVSGILYESDLQIISKCTSLEHLDLSQTYTTYSPEEAKKRQAEMEFHSALFDMISSGLDAQYENLEISTGEYLSSKVWAELGKDAASITTSDPGCVIPFNSINGLRRLKTLILPLRASKIENANFRDCISLSNIHWPLYLTSIGSYCFSGCTSLTELKLPSTVNEIGEYEAFKDCTKLAFINLSNCTFKSTKWSRRFENVAPHLMIHLPQGIRVVDNYFSQDKVYFPSSLEGIQDYSIENSELHFAGKVAPEGGSRCENCKVYVPKNSLTSYYNSFGGQENGNEFFEE